MTPEEPVSDDPFDRKGVLDRLAADLTRVHGESFRHLTDAEKIRDAVHLCQGPIQVAEIQCVLYRLTRIRVPHSVISNVLARGRKKGLLASPFSGVWLSLKDLGRLTDRGLSLTVSHRPRSVAC